MREHALLKKLRRAPVCRAFPQARSTLSGAMTEGQRQRRPCRGGSARR